jgi:hypothetical protein
MSSIFKCTESLHICLYSYIYFYNYELLRKRVILGICQNNMIFQTWIFTTSILAQWTHQIKLHSHKKGLLECPVEAGLVPSWKQHKQTPLTHQYVNFHAIWGILWNNFLYISTLPIHLMHKWEDNIKMVLWEVGWKGGRGHGLDWSGSG